jgi:hypothetical protein
VKILFYTVAVGALMRDIMGKLDRCMDAERVLTENDLDVAVHPDLRPVWSARSRIREFVDLEGYDAVCFIESDVAVSSIEALKGDKILVERGDRSLADMLTDDPERPAPDVLSPWGGVVYVPRAQFAFLGRWVEEYQKLKGSAFPEELVLWRALQGFDWAMLDCTAFWPAWGEFRHFRGIEAKRSLLPDFSIRQGDEFMTALQATREATV